MDRLRFPWVAIARRTLLLVWSLGLVALVISIAVDAFSPVLLWEVQHRQGPGQLTVFNSTRQGGAFGLPVEMGDYDGDAKVDLVIAPMNAESGPIEDRRASAGEVYVYRGNGVIDGVIDRKTMGAQPAGLTLRGARADDFLGTEVFSADVNGDAITDLLVSSQNYDGPDGSRDNCGGVFIIFGRAGLLGETPEEGVTIDLASPPAGVVTIIGRAGGERLGIWCEAGDLDGDKIADVIIGSDQANGPGGKAHSGLVAVVYGRQEFTPVLDLGLAGEEGGPGGVSVILGKDPEDHFGSCLHARDLDGDGRAELIAAAALNRLSASYGGRTGFPSHSSGGADGPENLREECGEVQVIFSDAANDGRLPPVVDLQSPTPEMAPRITLIYGEKRGGATGEEMTTGDYDGDKFPDLVLGALTAPNQGGDIQAGAAYILYWGPDLKGTTIDLRFPETFPPGLSVTTLRGAKLMDILGDTLSTGDFNHDGIDDLAVGIPHETRSEPLVKVGEVAILYGRPERFPPVIIPDNPESIGSLTVTFVLGANAQDFLSYSMEARDYDGDGYTDLFPNAMRGDGSAEDALDAGEAYLISGFHLSGGQVMLQSVVPGQGPVGEEVPVTLEGCGFTRDEDTRVFAGGLAASEVKVISGTRLTCRFPPRPEPATVGVTVENRYGSATLPQGFSYLAAILFIRGDATRDGVLDISDPIHALGVLFLGETTTCADALDANDDGLADISDAIYLLSSLFLGGPDPLPPFPGPGPDPSLDEINCTSA